MKNSRDASLHVVTPRGLSARRSRGASPAAPGRSTRFPPATGFGPARRLPLLFPPSGPPPGTGSRFLAPLCSSVCLSRGPDHREPETKLPPKEKKAFLFHTFSLTKQREIIFQGRPRRNRPLHRQRAGDSAAPPYTRAGVG